MIKDIVILLLYTVALIIAVSSAVYLGLLMFWERKGHEVTAAITLGVHDAIRQIEMRADLSTEDEEYIISRISKKVEDALNKKEEQ